MSLVIPPFWNGHRGCVSLTFDDGTPEQLQHAVPELDQRGMQGTFFVIQSPEKTLRKYDTQFRSDEWRAVAASGHEIGGHSITHLMPTEMQAQPAQAHSEVIECQRFLQETLATPITSYAYPFTYVDENVEGAVRTAFKQARGLVDLSGGDKYILPQDSPNLFNIPSIQVNDRNIDRVGMFAATAYNRRAWVTLMFHGVGPNTKVFDNVSTEKFATALDAIRRYDVAVMRFDEAASRLRARPA